MTVQSIAVKLLRPTQIAVGKRLVKMKRKGLREREGKPQELVDFILANPLRVVLGPNDEIHIIDHHHLGCALMKEGFKTAPVIVEADLSKLALPEFWTTMEGKAWVHPFDGKGKRRKISDIPDDLLDMEDDPYRSLAGVVRQEGGFNKTLTPYMEFAWADYFRHQNKLKALNADFTGTVKKALALASAPEAAKLPGYKVAATS